MIYRLRRCWTWSQDDSIVAVDVDPASWISSLAGTARDATNTGVPKDDGSIESLHLFGQQLIQINHVQMVGVPIIYHGNLLETHLILHPDTGVSRTFRTATIKIQVSQSRCHLALHELSKKRAITSHEPWTIEPSEKHGCSGKKYCEAAIQRLCGHRDAIQGARCVFVFESSCWLQQ